MYTGIMYNLRNVNYIKEILKDKNRTTRLHSISVYKEFILWLDMQNKLIKIEDNYFTNLIEKDFQRFVYETGNINSYQAIVVKVNNLNYIFNELELDISLHPMKPVEIEKNLNEIWDKKEILNICRNLVNPQDQVIIYGLFLGITIEELRLLETKNIDLENNKIKLLDSTIIDIDEDFHIFLKYCIETDIYWKLGEPINGTTNPYFELDKNSPYLLKPKPQNKAGYRNHFTVSGIRTRVFNISKCFEQYNIKISPKRLQISGLLYKLNEIEKENNIEWNNKTLTDYKDSNNIKGFVPELLISYKQKYKN